MPIKHAAEKALRQTKRHTLRNALVLRKLDMLEKQARKFIADKSSEVKTALINFQKTIDKAVRRNIVKANAAARRKARLMRPAK